jgi:type I restriction enzyme M protein
LTLLEAKLSEAQGELAEAVEVAQEAVAYEPEEDETVNAAAIKKALKEALDDLEDSQGVSATKERELLKSHDKAIAALEKPSRKLKPPSRCSAMSWNSKYCSSAKALST